MLEGARAGLGELSQHRGVDVGKLDQGHRRGEAKQLLDEENQDVGKREHGAVDGKLEERVPVVVGKHTVEVALVHDLEGNEAQAVDQEDIGRATRQLRAPRQLLDRDDGNVAGQKLHHDKLGLIVGHQRAQYHHNHVDEKRCARVAEGGDNDGHQGKGDDAQIGRAEGHHDLYHDHKKRVEGDEKHHLAQVGKRAGPHELHEDVEHNHDDRHKCELSQYAIVDAVGVHLALAHHALIGLQYHVLLRGDQVAGEDDALARLHHSARGQGFLIGVVEQFLGLDRVVEHIRLQIVGNRYRRQHRAVLRAWQQGVEVGIGLAHRGHVLGRYQVGHLVGEHAHLRQLVARYLVVGVVVDDAVVVDAAHGAHDGLAHRGACLGLDGKSPAQGIELLVDHTVVGAVYFHKVDIDAVDDAVLGDGVILDGDVERCLEHGIGPRLALAVVEVAEVLAGQAEGDECRGHDQHGYDEEIVAF